MAEHSDRGVSIERIENLSIVSLKIARKFSDSVRGSLQLDDSRSLWLGPDRCLLVSPSSTPDDIISCCKATLSGVLHNAVDYSAGLVALRISGANARQLLASGSGVDFRAEKFPPGACCRTRLAQIAAVVVADAADVYDIYVDRSYESYLCDWLAASANIYRSYLNQAGDFSVRPLIQPD